MCQVSYTPFNKGQEPHPLYSRCIIKELGSNDQDEDDIVEVHKMCPSPTYQFQPEYQEPAEASMLALCAQHSDASTDDCLTATTSAYQDKSGNELQSALLQAAVSLLVQRQLSCLPSSRLTPLLPFVGKPLLDRVDFDIIPRPAAVDTAMVLWDEQPHNFMGQIACTTFVIDPGGLMPYTHFCALALDDLLGSASRLCHGTGGFVTAHWL